jgi:hypothetical protein
MEKIFKPFNLQKAIAGEPICDTVGNCVKFVAYEPAAEMPVACLFNGKITTYGQRGNFFEFDGYNAQIDLRMAEDVNECLCRLLQDEEFLVDGRAGRVEEQARAIRKVLGL